MGGKFNTGDIAEGLDAYLDSRGFQIDKDIDPTDQIVYVGKKPDGQYGRLLAPISAARYGMDDSKLGLKVDVCGEDDDILIFFSYMLREKIEPDKVLEISRRLSPDKETMDLFFRGFFKEDFYGPISYEATEKGEMLRGYRFSPRGDMNIEDVVNTLGRAIDYVSGNIEINAGMYRSRLPFLELKAPPAPIRPK